MIRRFEAFLTGITLCYKYIQRIKNAEMTELGLKGTHVACMFFLYHCPGELTSSQLCSLCCEDKASISRIVADLRSRGYLHQTSGKNYRSTLLLTEAGTAIAQRMDPLIESWVSIGGEGMTEQDRETFYRCLTQIAKNLRTKLDSQPV